MAIAILVLTSEAQAYAFSKRVQNDQIPIASIELVEPLQLKKNISQNEIPDKENELDAQKRFLIKKVKINDVKLLNPKLSQKIRQKNMSLWLMPFGLIAGLTFAGMTNLNTFSKFGFSQLGEVILGGLLGMGSGWIGSFFASSSVNPYKKDIESLRKKHEQGKWLLILQTGFEVDLPWGIIREIEPIELVRLNEL